MYIDWREFEAYRLLVGKHLLNILLGRCGHIWQSIVKMDHKEWKWSVCVFAGFMMLSIGRTSGRLSTL